MISRVKSVHQELISKLSIKMAKNEKNIEALWRKIDDLSTANGLAGKVGPYAALILAAIIIAAFAKMKMAFVG